MSDAAVKPNAGSAVPDTVAAGEHFETQDEWLAQRGVQREGRIVLKKLAHVRYQHPDLDEISTFLKGTFQRRLDMNTSTKYFADFGMEVAKKGNDEIWSKGYGPDPYVYYAKKGPRKFLGGTFEVQSKQDFDR